MNSVALVPGVGIEPTRPIGHGILSPARLPFRHPGRSDILLDIWNKLNYY